MENISHSLFGAAMSKAGLERLTPLAMPTCVIAANLPDVDAVSLFGGSESYFKYHRGITHSFVGVCVLSVALAFVVQWVDRKIRLRRNPNLPPTSFSGLLLVSFLGLLSHLFMDYTTTYGVRPWLPLSGRWFYGDLVFIVDPWIWIILGIGLLGSWWKRDAGRRGAMVSLFALLAYWGALFTLHQAAVDRVARLDKSTLRPQERVTAGALPTFANPFEWHCIVETPTKIFTWRENLLRTASPLSAIQFFDQPQIPAIMSRIAQTSTGRDFFEFARFSKTDAKEEGDRIEVILQELRFNLRADFVLDNHLNVLTAKFLL